MNDIVLMSWKKAKIHHIINILLTHVVEMVLLQIIRVLEASR